VSGECEEMHLQLRGCLDAVFGRQGDKVSLHPRGNFWGSAKCFAVRKPIAATLLPSLEVVEDSGGVASEKLCNAGCAPVLCGESNDKGACTSVAQRLSGRERRSQAWVNHCLSKAIVCRAQATNSPIALEDLPPGPPAPRIRGD